MKNINNLFLALLLTLSYGLQGQQLPVLNQYLYNPYLYNPARTGDNELGSVNINFKRQWTAMPYSPITGILSMETPLKGYKMGIGGMVYSDNTHIINRIGGMGSYAYHIPFSKEYTHHLSAGVSMGFIHQSFDFQSAQVENPDDPNLLNSDARGTSFDFCIGLNYRWKELNVGFSMLQGLSNEIKFLSSFGQEVSYVNSRHFMANVSYDFRVGKEKEFLIRPVVLTRIIPNLPVQAEVNVVGNWKQLLWASLGYRSSNWKTLTSALTASFGVELKKKIFVGYTFEITPSASLVNSLGTQHEVMISYRFGRDEEREKEMLSLKEELQQIRENDKLLSEKIDNTNKGIEEIKQRTQKLEENNNELNSKIDNVNNQINSKLVEIDNKIQNNVNSTEDLKKSLKDQSEVLHAHQNAIDQNRKAIEELRAAIKNQPLKYKKMGEINFSSGSAEITTIEKSKFEALKEYLTKNPKSLVYLYGNASTDGDPHKNMELSSKRCIAVRKKMIEFGISSEKIMVLPMGQENTISGDKKVNASDRRVDIVVTE
jgi:type IX secretion system PorP/SprF family membrane protein